VVQARRARRATDLLREVLAKPPGLTFVVIQEVDLEEWGVDGLPAAQHRRRAAAGSTG
jgi:4-oxalocrotonate tautomerase